MNEGTAILCLDPALSTGWAILTPEGRVDHGTINLRGGKFDSFGMRFVRLRRWLTDSKATFGGFSEVWFEEVRAHKGTDAAHLYGGLIATIMTWAEHHEIPYGGVPVGTWKKDLTGNGNAGKEIVMTSVQVLGFDPDTQDAADALGILHSVIGGLGSLST